MIGMYFHVGKSLYLPMYLTTIGISVHHVTALNVLLILEAISHLFKASVFTLISPFLHPPESDTLTSLLTRMEIQHLEKPRYTRSKTSMKCIH